MLDYKSILLYNEQLMLFSKIRFFFTIASITCCCSVNALAYETNYYFPEREVSLGFFDDAVLPNNIPHPPHPLFWKSKTKVDFGLTAAYQYTVFHTRKYFSIQLGTGLSVWMVNSHTLVAASFFFVFRVWLFRTERFNPYFDWSMAGPTLLSSNTFGPAKLSMPFIFQDFLGFGAMVGKNHHFDVNLNLYHYSNGDLFLHNDGFDVPVVLTVGYIFNL